MIPRLFELDGIIDSAYAIFFNIRIADYHLTTILIEGLPRNFVCVVAGAIFTVVFLGLYKMVPAEWRSRVVFPLLGVLQVVQYLLTVGGTCEWWDSLISAGDASDPFHSSLFFPALGSTVVFPTGIMIVLLLYLKKNVYEFYRLASWLLAVNVALVIAAFAVGQLGVFSEASFWSRVFSSDGASRIFLGTLLTLTDCYVMLIVYDALRRWPMGHLIVPLMFALIFDAVFYSFLLAGLGHTPLETALAIHLPAKLIAGLVFGGILQVFIRRYCPAFYSDPPLTVSGLKFLKALVWPIPLFNQRNDDRPPTQNLFSKWWRSGVVTGGVVSTGASEFDSFVGDAVYEVERFTLIRFRVVDVPRAMRDIREWSANHSVNGWMTVRDGMLDILLLGLTAKTAKWALEKIRASEANSSASQVGECVLHDHAHPPMPPTSVAELIERAQRETSLAH